MRHDPAGASIVIMLRSLKLYGMANAVEDLVAQGGPAFDAATPMLSQLLKAEISEREVRSIAYQTKVARFPATSTRLLSGSCTDASSWRMLRTPCSSVAQGRARAMSQRPSGFRP